MPEETEENLDGCELDFTEDAISDEDAAKLLTPLGEDDGLVDAVVGAFGLED